MKLFTSKKLIVGAALLAVAAYLQFAPVNGSCCKRKHANHTIVKVSDRPQPNPNCAHGRMISEMRRQGRLRYYIGTYTNWAVSSMMSGPTIPPGPWDDPCDCPEACVL